MLKIPLGGEGVEDETVPILFLAVAMGEGNKMELLALIFVLEDF